MTRNVITFLLGVMLVGAVIPVLLRAAMYLPIIALFGFDSPNTTVLEYLGGLAVPVIAVACIIAAAVATFRLWRTPATRWRYASFPIALGLLAVAVWIWVETTPH